MIIYYKQINNINIPVIAEVNNGLLGFNQLIKYLDNNNENVKRVLVKTNDYLITMFVNVRLIDLDTIHININVENEIKLNKQYSNFWFSSNNLNLSNIPTYDSIANLIYKTDENKVSDSYSKDNDYIDNFLDIVFEDDATVINIALNSEEQESELSEDYLPIYNVGLINSKLP